MQGLWGLLRVVTESLHLLLCRTMLVIAVGEVKCGGTRPESCAKASKVAAAGERERNGHDLGQNFGSRVYPIESGHVAILRVHACITKNRIVCEKEWRDGVRTDQESGPRSALRLEPSTAVSWQPSRLACELPGPLSLPIRHPIRC